MAYVERQRGGRRRVPMGERNACIGWTRVCELADIEPGRGVVRVVNGAEVAVMRDGDEVFALGNLCRHRGGLTDLATLDAELARRTDLEWVV